MTVYNKLKVAILAIISSQSIHAITVDPIQIQSGSGDLLYAEMPFRNSDSTAKIEVGLAEPEDLIRMGVAHQPPGHLNFYTRRSGDGSGVIVITSSRPVVETELNILLKIKEGNNTHIQQIRTPLTRNRLPTAPVTPVSGAEQVLKPQIIVSEKDIQLNLPTSASFNVQSMVPPPMNTPLKNAIATLGDETPKAISVAPVHTPSATSITVTPKAETAISPAATPPTTTAASPQAAHQVQAEPATTVVAPAAVASEPPPETQSTAAVPSQPPADTPQNNAQKNTQTAHQQNKSTTADQNQRHIVQANESLWKIASRIAAQTNQSVPAVMRQIKANNAHAFIQGDINRIRQGVALNLAAGVAPPAAQRNKQPPAAPVTTQKQSAMAKYRLNQAEMSLVAESQLDAAHGASRKDQSQNQTSAELSSKVMTSREKTVKLQKNVSELAMTLQTKDQRIQLLNARLAQLQKQLEQQNRAKKTTQ